MEPSLGFRSGVTQVIGVTAGRQEEGRARREPAALPADRPLASSEVLGVPGLRVPKQRVRAGQSVRACRRGRHPAGRRQLSARFPCICRPPTQDDIRVLEPERARDLWDVMNKVKMSHLRVHCLVEKKNGEQRSTLKVHNIVELKLML